MDTKACRKGPCVSLITDPGTVLHQDNCWPMGSYRDCTTKGLGTKEKQREKYNNFLNFIIA